MHPTLSHHYEEDLAFLSWLVGQFQFENSCFALCFLRESNPGPGTPLNHLLITVRTFQLH